MPLGRSYESKALAFAPSENDRAKEIDRRAQLAGSAEASQEPESSRHGREFGDWRNVCARAGCRGSVRAATGAPELPRTMYAFA